MTSLIKLTDADAQPYTQYHFTVNGTASSTYLGFAFRPDPGYWYIDDISLHPIPLPTAVLLLGSGLVGLLGFRRFKK